MQARIAIAGLALGIGPVALGQNALGDGRALDNSLSANSPYNYQRPNLANEIQFRNAIVTGNAPGGLNFRGDVGYMAPGDFRGELGSDELFAFRRDSLYSGLAGMGIRGTDALQFQFSMTTGAAPPRNLVGSLTLNRGFPNEVSTGRLPTDFTPSTPIQRAPETLDAEPGSLLWALRAPSAYESNRGYQPMLLGRNDESEEDAAGVTASELRGVRRADLVDTPAGRIDTSMAAEPIETNYLRLVEKLNEEAAALAQQPADAQPGQAQPGSAQPGAAQPGAEPADTRPEWVRRMQELRDQLTQPIETPEEKPAEGEAQPGGVSNLAPGIPQLSTDADTLKMLRSIGGGAPSADFVPPDALGVYAEHMKVGQRLLGSERYFDAEERFAQALAMRPRDVDAQVGRIHAQIGAGMYLSAAANLRKLLSDHPHLVAERYDASLLPSSARIDQVESELRGVLDPRDDQNASSTQLGSRVAGLLLAYLGYQTGDLTTMEQGINAARTTVQRSYERQPNDEDVRDARLLDLIEQVHGEKEPE